MIQITISLCIKHESVLIMIFFSYHMLLIAASVVVILPLRVDFIGKFFELDWS